MVEGQCLSVGSQATLLLCSDFRSAQANAISAMTSPFSERKPSKARKAKHVRMHRRPGNRLPTKMRESNSSPQSAKTEPTKQQDHSCSAAPSSAHAMRRALLSQVEFYDGQLAQPQRKAPEPASAKELPHVGAEKVRVFRPSQNYLV